MSACYIMKIEDQTEQQSRSDTSFIGGVPVLPSDHQIPQCTLCGAEQTFYFQVAFPPEHVWDGLTMAVFACTSCAVRGAFIPEMLTGRLHGVEVPKDFLTNYQTNFRVLVFSTHNGIMRNDYQMKVKFKRIELVRSDDPDVEEHKVGGNPNWILEDETPGSYQGGISMELLLQFLQGYEFEILTEAPRQMELEWLTTSKPSEDLFYKLFIQNQLYFFGTVDQDHPLVYILTQV
ncbi:hypothetical protein [Tumebacillus permanentifrigoris]|uniref:Uncharacterized protein n=1 Tax=Tumebacillus permanentifrigoris TaxID=378543 RepID=A0A316DAD1_9BACL|nr:hypothetical protein [Tumebacillus permanentifrigoris]PWK14455.1 hypothetical protein C7459_105213 [Tumebacillus permanentifrigoris]